MDFYAKTFPYITAVVRETLRLNPASVILLEEAIHDTELAGYHVPAGTEFFLLTRLTGLLHTPTERPFEFLPERWVGLEERDPELFKRQANLLLGFGYGPRVCPGRFLAITEMTMIVALVFSGFEITPLPRPPSVLPVIEEDRFTNCPGNLYLQLSPVNG